MKFKLPLFLIISFIPILLLIIFGVLMLYISFSKDVSAGYYGTPYTGNAFFIPGRIEAEKFDNGGDGVAYHDLDVSNLGGAYRTSEGVDIYAGTNISSYGYYVGNFIAGEYMRYTIGINGDWVSSTSRFSFTIRAGSYGSSSSVSIFIDESLITTISIPQTPTNSFTTVTVEVPTGVLGSLFTPGQHVLMVKSGSTYTGTPNYGIALDFIDMVTETFPGYTSSYNSCWLQSRQYNQCGGSTGIEDLPTGHLFSITETRDCYGTLKPYQQNDLGIIAGECGNPTPTPRPTPTPTPTPPTSSMVTPTPTTSTSNTIKPEIIAPKTGSVLGGTVPIKVKAAAGSLVDLQIQPTSGNMGALFIGRIEFSANVTEGAYSWNTTNTPNGEYELFARVSKPGGSELIAGPVKVKVSNTANTKPQPTPTGSSGTKVEATQSANPIAVANVSDIVFPTEFDPNKIPVNEGTSITKIENVKHELKDVLKFSGKSIPNTIITLLIFSNPVVVTVKTDENGFWSYDLEKPLEPGKHIVYAVVPQANGVKVRSQLSEFFISPVIAAGSNESLILASPPEDTAIRNFILTTAGLTLLAIGLVFVLYWNKKRVVVIIK